MIYTVWFVFGSKVVFPLWIIYWWFKYKILIVLIMRTIHTNHQMLTFFKILIKQTKNKHTKQTKMLLSDAWVPLLASDNFSNNDNIPKYILEEQTDIFFWPVETLLKIVKTYYTLQYGLCLSCAMHFWILVSMFLNVSGKHNCRFLNAIRLPFT